MRAAAAMAWRPQDFWTSTPREFRIALEGFARSRGVKFQTFAERVQSGNRLEDLRALNDNPEPEAARERS